MYQSEQRTQANVPEAGKHTAHFRRRENVNAATRQ